MSPVGSQLWVEKEEGCIEQGAEGVCKGGIGKMDQGTFAGEGGKEEWRP